MTPDAEDLSDDDKAKARSVSLAPDTWAEIDAIVAKSYAGVRSRYFQELVALDLQRRKEKPRARAGSRLQVSESALDELAEAVAGRVLQRIETHFAQQKKSAGERSRV